MGCKRLEAEARRLSSSMAQIQGDLADWEMLGRTGSEPGTPVRSQHPISAFEDSLQLTLDQPHASDSMVLDPLSVAQMMQDASGSTVFAVDKASSPPFTMELNEAPESAALQLFGGITSPLRTTCTTIASEDPVVTEPAGESDSQASESDIEIDDDASMPLALSRSASTGSNMSAFSEFNIEPPPQQQQEALGEEAEQQLGGSFTFTARAHDASDADASLPALPQVRVQLLASDMGQHVAARLLCTDGAADADEAGDGDSPRKQAQKVQPGDITSGLSVKAPAAADMEGVAPAVPAMPAARDDSLVLVLLGKTGNGKSSTGNTILSSSAFKARRSIASVTTAAQVETGFRNGRRITVIDTPGLFDTCSSPAKVAEEVSAAMTLAGGAVHAFLLVLSATCKFTAEERACIACLRERFGDALWDHCIAVFTHGDELEQDDTQLEDYLMDAPADLQAVLDRLEGRTAVINNRAASRAFQVDDLLARVDCLLARNAGRTFTGRPVTPRKHLAGAGGQAMDSDDDSLDAELRKHLHEGAITLDESEVAELLARYEHSEAARRDLERQIREANKWGRGAIVACTVGGLLCWKVLTQLTSKGGQAGGEVRPITLPIRGQLTWSFEPLGLGTQMQQICLQPSPALERLTAAAAQ
ncbi:hypothetical protein WJX72_011200 [[Myrmecia] bisecta]|uniref:AIG1-type G domain-containing protein n=1 Tax=[Myrmecia] bisecta TaxID=41462 RepID=A0AAW1P3R2_9CHLO